MVKNEAECCRSTSRIKGSKEGAGRGVMISVLVGCSTRERREELDEGTTDSCESALWGSYDGDR